MAPKAPKTKKTSTEKRYIQAGLCSSGDGSKCHPWNSLLSAQSDPHWTTLIVLPSPLALDYGITLRDCQRLIGSSKGPGQCIISNSSSETNEGNAIIVNGSNIIENITFQDTFASAVQYTNATQLIIGNCHVSRYNFGYITAPIIYPFSNPDDPINRIYVGGLFRGSNNTSNIGATGIMGKVLFSNVTIGNGFAGSVIADLQPTDICIEQGKFSGLRSFAPEQPGLLLGVEGLLIVSSNSLLSHVKIKDSTFSDFSGGSFSPKHISIILQESSIAHTSVKNCFFSEPIQEVQSPVTAIEILTVNSKSDITGKGNTFNNVFHTVTTRDSGNSQANLTLLRNNVTAFDQFYSALAIHSPTGNPKRQVTIKDNQFIGGITGGAILVGSNLGGPASWDNFTMNLTGNCFLGKDIAFSAFLGVNFGSNPVGAGKDVTITGSNNNFEGFIFDILDFGFFGQAANINYLLPRNWWGPNGPDNIDNNGSGIVDVSHPLTEPISCSSFPYCLPTDQLNFGPRRLQNRSRGRGLHREDIIREQIQTRYQ